MTKRDKLCLVCFLFLLISNAITRLATFSEYLRNKHLIHTFRLAIKRQAPSQGFAEISMEADEQQQQHPAAQTQDKRLNPPKCVPCVGLSYSSRVQNMTENVCFISLSL